MSDQDQYIIKKINTEQSFSDMVFRSARAQRFGISGCCPTDIDKIALKKELCDWEDLKIPVYTSKVYTYEEWLNTPTATAPSWGDSDCGPLPLTICSGSVNVCLYLDGNNLMYYSNAIIAGFQFDHDGCVVTGSGGDAENVAGFTIIVGATNLVAFSSTGGTIPVGEGVLIELGGTITIDCLSNFIFGDPGGDQLTVGVADKSDCDLTCLFFEVVNQDGNPVEGYPVVVDGGNIGITDEYGNVRTQIPKSSVDTVHTIDLCKCITTVGNCSQMKIVITLTEECPVEVCTTPEAVCSSTDNFIEAAT